MRFGKFDKGPTDNNQFWTHSWKLFPIKKGFIRLRASPHNSIVLECSREQAMKCFILDNPAPGQSFPRTAGLPVSRLCSLFH